MKKLALLSGIKLPEHIRTSYPKLVAFVEAYYRFMESRIGVMDAADIDTTSDMFLRLYKDTVARGFGDPEFLDVRKFIHANKDFFSRKGTADAFKFFFRAYYGQEIELTKPDYLIASGGMATGDHFFYVTADFGALEEYDDIQLRTATKIARVGQLTASTVSDTVTSNKPSFISTDVGLKIHVNSKILGVINEVIDDRNVKLTTNANFECSGYSFHLTGGFVTTSLNVLRFKQLDSNTYAIYFVPPNGFTIAIDDAVTVGTSVLTFRGRVKATPYKAIPVAPGSDWQKGQIIQLPTVNSNDYAVIRVTDVTSTGGIKALEFLQYAYPIAAQSYSILPTQTTASNSTDSNNYSQVLMDGGSFDEALDVYDNTGSVDDLIVISLTNTESGSYFDDDYPNDYALEDYSGTLMGYDPYQFSVGPSQQVNPENIASLATIQIEYGEYSKERTIYSQDHSLLSNQTTRLHDSLDWQAFAYGIQTSVDIKQYRGAIDLLHPAGTRFSATHVKEFAAINTDISIIGSHVFPSTDGNVLLGVVGNVNVGIALDVDGNETTTQLGQHGIE